MMKNLLDIFRWKFQGGPSFDRGATLTAELTSYHYRRSPLIQGGMEISCKITAKISGTVIKANHLEYIEPRWYGSRISADCQQKLLFTKHDTSGRFLLVTFLEKQKKEDGTHR